MNNVVLVIPSYEPDERLIILLKELVKEDVGPIIIVNDGSGKEYNSLFLTAKNIISSKNGLILEYDVNKGKGRALKIAFSYLIDNVENLIGIVTADSDGQHSVNAIKTVMKTLEENPTSFVLGTRKFDSNKVPWTSRIGNKITEKVFSYLTGLHITDTQTGLRGIPIKFMNELLETKGERFEFEMRMLLESVGKYNIIEVPIETIYDSAENHQTHFNPFKDSTKIYLILLEKFIKFSFSSLSSSIIDLIMFYCFCLLLSTKFPIIYTGVATILSRIISAFYNFTINYKVVFNSKKKKTISGFKYCALAMFQMLFSAIFVVLITRLFPNIQVIIFKILIDSLLFIVSYKIQNKYIFN